MNIKFKNNTKNIFGIARLVWQQSSGETSPQESLKAKIDDAKEQITDLQSNLSGIENAEAIIADLQKNVDSKPDEVRNYCKLAKETVKLQNQLKERYGDNVFKTYPKIKDLYTKAQSNTLPLLVAASTLQQRKDSLQTVWGLSYVILSAQTVELKQKIKGTDLSVINQKEIDQLGKGYASNESAQKWYELAKDRGVVLGQLIARYKDVKGKDFPVAKILEYRNMDPISAFPSIQDELKILREEHEKKEKTSSLLDLENQLRNV